MRKTQIAIAVLTVITLTPANGMAAESVPAEPAMASGDVVYFQDMKEFEPRAWDDGSHQGGIAYLATALDTLREKKAIPSLLSVGNWPLEAYLARYFAVSLL